MKKWIGSLKLFSATYEIRQSLYGFSIILKTGLNHAPKSFTKELKTIMDCIVFLLERYVTANQKAKLLGDAEDIQDEGETGTEEFKNIMGQLQSISGTQKAPVEDDEDGFEDETGEFQFDQWWKGDLRFYDSALESQDPVLFFRDSMLHI